MGPAFFMLIQATAQAPACPVDSSGGTPDRLVRITLNRECTGGSPDEIVVCGSRGEESPYRLRALPPGFERGPWRPEGELIDGVTGGVHLEAGSLPNGMVSKRIMVKIKTKF